MLINGEDVQLDSIRERSGIRGDLNVTVLLSLYGLSPERVAVELNGSIIRKQTFDSTKINNVDKIEIIHKKVYFLFNIFHIKEVIFELHR